MYFTKHTKKGFTMIELIFVIIILGALAAVVIPKLATTRDDALYVKNITNIKQALIDISAYYTTRGHFGNLKDITNISNFQNYQSATLPGEINYMIKNASCITFSVNLEGNLTLKVVGTSDLCLRISNSKAFNLLKKTYIIGGTHIK